MNSEYNLVDEKWIPMSLGMNVSIKDIFLGAEGQIAGTELEKISITKLLLAISQAAWTPQDTKEWDTSDKEALSERCLNYLEEHYDSFFLYGSKPFLQIPDIAIAKKTPIASLLPQYCAGNATVLFESQVKKSFSDEEKARVILQTCGFSLGGKKTDAKAVLTEGLKKKTAPPGPSLGFLGFIHSFVIGSNALETLFFNLTTLEELDSLGFYKGVGAPPWEVEITEEISEKSDRYKDTLIGRLLPLSRFSLLDGDSIHYAEGLKHDGYADGMFDLSMSIDIHETSKKSKAKWCNPEKKPWRELLSLITVSEQSKSSGFKCYQILFFLKKLEDSGRSEEFGVWSGGLRVSSNAGEQYVSGQGDFISSSVLMNSEWNNEVWIDQLKLEILKMEKVATSVYMSSKKYFEALNSSSAAGMAGKSSRMFWELNEKLFQDMLEACESKDKMTKIRGLIANNALLTYDTFCPAGTARQITSWSKNRPKLFKYIKGE